MDNWLLNNDVHKARISHFDGIHFAIFVCFDEHLQHGAKFREAGLVRNSEVCNQVALGAGNKLGGFTTYGDKLSVALNLINNLTEKICIEGAAKAFISGENKDATGFDLSLLEEGMRDGCTGEVQLLADGVE